MKTIKPINLDEMTLPQLENLLEMIEYNMEEMGCKGCPQYRQLETTFNNILNTIYKKEREKHKKDLLDA